MRNKYTIFCIVFLFCLSALIMLRQLISGDYFSCIIEDSYTYTSWAWQFVEALKEGVIYPRWMPLNFWGYGSPTFILYPPFAFYLVGFFNIFTDSIIAAMNISKFIALFLSSLGMFFLVKEFYSEKIALLTASFYAVFPYNVFQFYYLGTFASTISFMWFSPILLFLCKYFGQRNYRYVIFSGMCYGGLILTHLINAYIFTFVIITFVIYISIVNKNLKDLIILPLTAIIGLLISATYIFPVLFEKRFLNMNFFIGEGGGFRFDYHNFFILPNMTGLFSYGHLWPTYYSTYLFFLFFSCVLMLLSLLRTVRMNHSNSIVQTNAINRYFFLAGIGSIFMLFGVSTIVWESLPLSKYIQFPVRWLNVTSISVVFLSSAIFRSFINISKKKVNNLFIVISIFFVCVLLDYQYISSAFIFDHTKLIPVKAANWNLEHLPIWAKGEMISGNNDQESVEILRGQGAIAILEWKSTKRVFKITAQKPTTVRLKTLYFPGWKAYINSIETEIITEKDTGAMLIDIPQGSHKIEFSFVDTPVRYYGKLISLFSVFLIFFALLLNNYRKRKVYQCQKSRKNQESYS